MVNAIVLSQRYCSGNIKVDHFDYSKIKQKPAVSQTKNLIKIQFRIYSHSKCSPFSSWLRISPHKVVIIVEKLFSNVCIKPKLNSIILLHVTIFS